MNSESQSHPAAAAGRLPVVVVADDHALVRDGVRGLIISVLGECEFIEADDGDSLLKAASSQVPITVALVDLNMPGMERGFRLAELARLNPWMPVVVVSALTSPDVVRRTLEIPTVHAFIPKSAPSAQLCGAIEAAVNGVKLPFAHRIADSKRPEIILTPRMEEVRLLLRQGMSNKAIAGALGISEGTVKNYMSEIFRALNVSNRTQAAQLDSDTL